MVITVATAQLLCRRVAAASAAALLSVLVVVAFCGTLSAAAVNVEAESIAGAEASVVSTGFTVPTEGRRAVASRALVGSGAAGIVGGAVLLAAGAYAVGRWQQDQRIGAQSATWEPSAGHGA